MKADKQVKDFINEILNTLDLNKNKLCKEVYELEWENILDSIEVIK
jgi:hypothetical protein